MIAGRDPLEAELIHLLGEGVVRTDPIERRLFHRDASTFDRGTAALVCVPTEAEQVKTIVSSCASFGRPFVARGSGTGLAGGAIPCGDRPVVISLTQLDEIVEVNVDGRYAWVEPGVINLDLSNAVTPFGLHFAPDPSSQQASTIGGNLANNAGGPHCLAYGTTNAHILAVEMVLPSGELVQIGRVSNEPCGYDLRGIVVGSEGMFGVVTKIAVRLTPNPTSVSTLLASFSTVSEAATAVGAIVAGGTVPAAMEMLDRNAIGLVEDFIHCGYPIDAEAVLLVEVDGEPGGVRQSSDEVERVCLANGSTEIKRAKNESERELLWKGRKSAFGAVARIKPDYYLHDTVVPRRHLVAVLDKIYEIAAEHDLTLLNVFHAGDGNLHPIIAYDSRDPGVMETVHAAGKQIIQVSLDHGGALSGEHGIGLEKMDYMHMMFSPAELEEQAKLRSVFDPAGISNPMKVIPTGASCGDIAHLDKPHPEMWV